MIGRLRIFRRRRSCPVLQTGKYDTDLFFPALMTEKGNLRMI